MLPRLTLRWKNLRDFHQYWFEPAENDIIYDEGLAYARKFDEAGVPTTIETYYGFIHDYGLLNPLDHIEAVKFSSEQGALALKKALFG